jgi:hypothetical protein
MILKKLDKADKANFEAELLNDKVKTFMMEEVRARRPQSDEAFSPDPKPDGEVDRHLDCRRVADAQREYPKLRYKRLAVDQIKSNPRPRTPFSPRKF